MYGIFEIDVGNWLTFASWSNLPNSSFSSLTSSCAEHCEDREVKPTMSAKRMLEIKKCLLLKGIRWIESSGLLGANRQNCFIAFSSFSLVQKCICAQKKSSILYSISSDRWWLLRKTEHVMCALTSTLSFPTMKRPSSPNDDGCCQAGPPLPFSPDALSQIAPHKFPPF